MVALISILTLVAAIWLSFLIQRIAVVALTMTGMSRESARFQARSAYLGVGYTTAESESMVNHPVRRRILSNLMFAGNVGAVTVIATLLVSFVQARDRQEALVCSLILIASLVLLILTIQSRAFDRLMTRLITHSLKRWTRIESDDLSRVLNIGHDYGISELPVRPGSFWLDQSLRELRLTDRGVLVLGIHLSDGSYHGAPAPDDRLRRGDTVVLYGHGDRVEDLAKQAVGSTSHESVDEGSSQ